MFFRSFPLNETGRDVIVGDLHGEYDEVVRGLKAMNFDRSRDRLFSVGDLVDRGEGSPRCLKFLSHPWVCAIRGNHEDMFLQLYEFGEPHPASLEYATSHNGMGWWRDVDQATRMACIAAWRELPIAIEIETSRGKVGVVHGEVPIGMRWDEFKAGIEAGDKKLIDKAVWGRDRIGRRDESGVPGIDRVFVGHTPVDFPTRLGNVFYIDTGLVFGKRRNNPLVGRLSMQEMTGATMVITAPIVPEDFLDLRVDEEAPSSPFGSYAS